MSGVTGRSSYIGPGRLGIGMGLVDEDKASESKASIGIVSG